jgi:hypothetical protein
MYKNRILFSILNIKMRSIYRRAVKSWRHEWVENAA